MSRLASAPRSSKTLGKAAYIRRPSLHRLKWNDGKAPPQPSCLWNSLLSLLSACAPLHADAGRFDAYRPQDRRYNVTRTARRCPSLRSPNLQPGDKDLAAPRPAATQSVSLPSGARASCAAPPILPGRVVFPESRPGIRDVREEGVTITVAARSPAGHPFSRARETAATSVPCASAVRGRPGVFVRASQDLAEAGFEQARIEKYLASMQEVPTGRPQSSDGSLQTFSPAPSTSSQQ